MQFFALPPIVWRKCFLMALIWIGLAASATADEAVKKTLADWEKARVDYAEGRYEDAMLSFTLFAASGFIEAAHALGVIHEEGKAAPRSMTKAMKYFECAANAGYAPSQLRLANHLLRTPEVKRDQGRAYFWAALAASNPKSDENLRQLAITLRDSAGRSVDQAGHNRLERQLSDWTPKSQICYFQR